jgi:hypothetical protein
MVEEIQKSNKRQSEYELIDVPSKYRLLDMETILSTDESKLTT